MLLVGAEEGAEEAVVLRPDEEAVAVAATGGAFVVGVARFFCFCSELTPLLWLLTRPPVLLRTAPVVGVVVGDGRVIVVLVPGRTTVILCGCGTGTVFSRQLLF